MAGRAFELQPIVCGHTNLIPPVENEIHLSGAHRSIAERSSPVQKLQRHDIFSRRPAVAQQALRPRKISRPVGKGKRSISAPDWVRALYGAPNILIDGVDVLAAHDEIQCANYRAPIDLIRGAIEKLRPHDGELAIAGQAAVTGRRLAVDRNLPRQESAIRDMS
jgi:hypothetical protein